MNKKLKLTIMCLAMLICMATSTSVQATYQSRSTGTVVKNTLTKDATSFMITVRQMEGAGQVMGLGETVNTSTGLATSASNNIDVHMQKNTEYGAMVILGVSDYGKQSGYIHNTIGGLATTTGNKSGVYELGNSNNPEWVAGGVSSAFSGYNSKYFNSYSTTASIQHRGDATYETQRWNGATNAYWVTSGYPVFCRASAGGAFSYGSGNPTSNRCARACCSCLRCWILMRYCSLFFEVGTKL